MCTWVGFFVSGGEGGVLDLVGWRVGVFFWITRMDGSSCPYLRYDIGLELGSHTRHVTLKGAPQNSHLRLLAENSLVV